MLDSALEMEPKTGLDNELMKTWFRFLRLQTRLTTAMASRLKELGLSVAQFDLISTLSQFEGITQQDLASRLFVTKGNVSGLVDRLEASGLVERRSIPGDRRSHAMHLTDKGRSLARAGIAAQIDYVETTLGRLPKSDHHALDRILKHWREHVLALAAQELKQTARPKARR
jgi:MarR family transcriptional regulator, organic hydroperoxide resistance regulator